MTAPGIDHPKFITLSQHSIVEVRLNTTTNQQSLFAIHSYKLGEVILKFDAASIQPTATYLTIQIHEGKHIELMPTFLQYTNHSCNPNVFFDTTSMELVCIQSIFAGDECCFFLSKYRMENGTTFLV